MTKLNINFDKICVSCDKKIRFYHKVDYLLTDKDTNRIIRKNTPIEEIESKQIIVEIFHAKCLREIVEDAQEQLRQYMKDKKVIKDEDLR